MLLLHQVGSVKIGEVVRYTVTYTPAHDRILPAPEQLYLRIRNTCNTALRAAFVHGPYSLYVDTYPSTFNPNEKFEHPRTYGVPEFEPMLKAGGTWSCRLLVPEHIRRDAGLGTAFGGGEGETAPQSVSWVINVDSQVIFSTSAAVHYEILLARDPKSLDIGTGSSGIPAVLLGGVGVGGGSSSSGADGDLPGQSLQPGRVSDYRRGRDGHHPDQPKGVFSRAIRLRIEDTADLWNKPKLPSWQAPSQPQSSTGENKPQKQPKQKKIHLVVLTHGLHSNLGADMLYLKESIDAAVRQAKIDRKARRARERREARAKDPNGEGKEEAKDEDEEDDDDDDDEEVVVRGYSGNATRTERGIKYLGKRLARYVLSMTYPDQPFLPSSKSSASAAAAATTPSYNESPNGHKRPASTTAAAAAHKQSGTHGSSVDQGRRGYKFTHISFIAHSLGGLIQTYAVAYIQKHSPTFFDVIQPVNFIAMASPFLGLNHENPLYVKFALDFGLVGRSGQDLGLTWRAPTLARSSWGAIVNLGENAHKKVLGEARPESKPLLRILPTGPAHIALKKFRNRTVYSNVVNDGIVPLRTSCLLFLDWQGLGRVEKARREAGLVETVVGFGWAELTGANVTAARGDKWEFDESEDEDAKKVRKSIEANTGGSATPIANTSNPNNTSIADNTSNPNTHDEHEVPQPDSNAVLEDDRQSLRGVPAPSAVYHRASRDSRGSRGSRGSYTSGELSGPTPMPGTTTDSAGWLSTATTNNNSPFTNFLNFFKNSETSSPPSSTPAAAASKASSQLPSPSPSPAPGVPERTSSPAPSQHVSHTPSFLAHHTKPNPIYKRSQTLRFDQSSPSSSTSLPADSIASSAGGGGGTGTATPTEGTPKSRVTSGQEFSDEALAELTGVGSASVSGSGNGDVTAPPKTSFFESATDIINPKLPTVEYIIDPQKRPRAIFHDRVYHPSDIPPPPLKRRTTTGALVKRQLPPHLQKTGSGTSVYSQDGSPAPPQHHDSIQSAQDYDDQINTNPDRLPDEVVDSANMKVEEKIARAYHRGLSWRKVLVKMEPDAHNNMIVRRMLANAFGWPVVQHMVDAHFSDAATARLRDEDEAGSEQARPLDEGPDEHGRETRSVKGTDKKSTDTSRPSGDGSSTTGTADTSGSGKSSKLSGGGKEVASRSLALHLKDKDIVGRDSMTWSDRDWDDSEAGDDSDDGTSSTSKHHHQHHHQKQKQRASPATPLPGTTTGPIPPFGALVDPLDPAHRSVPSSPTTPTGPSFKKPSKRLSWNWTEKIVGKQPRKTVMSPTHPSSARSSLSVPQPPSARSSFE